MQTFLCVAGKHTNSISITRKALHISIFVLIFRFIFLLFIFSSLQQRIQVYFNYSHMAVHLSALFSITEFFAQEGAFQFFFAFIFV